MKIRYRILSSLIIAIALSWTTGVLADDDDTTYYAQHSFYVYKGKHITTNYHTGILVPINSPIKITDMGRKKIKIRLPELDDSKFVIINAKKHSKKNMPEIKDRMLGTKKVSLKKFSKNVQEAIMSGEIIEGMTKEETLLAYGYPPAHVTPTTEANQWTYWVTKWNRIVITFKNDKIKKIKD